MHPPRFTNSISCSFMLTRLSGGAYSDTSIATLHDLLQIAFDWSDFHLHRFVIRGKAYGVSRLGGRMCSRSVVREFGTFITANRTFIPNYGDPYQHGETISTAFVESAVNQVLSKRFISSASPCRVRIATSAGSSSPPATLPCRSRIRSSPAYLRRLDTHLPSSVCSVPLW